MLVFWANKRLASGSGITNWKHVEQIQAIGITHIVNLRRNRHGKKVKQFTNLWLPIRDDKKRRPQRFYRDALRFYSKAIRRRNSKIVAVCKRGLCRSPSLVYFLLRANGCSPKKARNTVVKARSRAHICRAYRECGELFLVSRRQGL